MIDRCAADTYPYAASHAPHEPDDRFLTRQKAPKPTHTNPQRGTPALPLFPRNASAHLFHRQFSRLFQSQNVKLTVSASVLSFIPHVV